MAAERHFSRLSLTSWGSPLGTHHPFEWKKPPRQILEELAELRGACRPASGAHGNRFAPEPLEARQISSGLIIAPTGKVLT